MGPLRSLGLASLSMLFVNNSMTMAQNQNGRTLQQALAESPIRSVVPFNPSNDPYRLNYSANDNMLTLESLSNQAAKNGIEYIGPVNDPIDPVRLTIRTSFRDINPHYSGMEQIVDITRVEDDGIKDHVVFTLSTGVAENPDFVTSSLPYNKKQGLISTIVPPGDYFYDATDTVFTVGKPYSATDSTLRTVLQHGMNAIRYALELESNISVSGLPLHKQSFFSLEEREQVFGADGERILHQDPSIRPDASISYKNGVLKLVGSSSLQDSLTTYSRLTNCTFSYKDDSDTLFMRVNQTDSEYSFENGGTYEEQRLSGEVAFTFASGSRPDLSRMDRADIRALEEANIASVSWWQEQPIDGLATLQPIADEQYIGNENTTRDTEERTLSNFFRDHSCDALRQLANKRLVLQ